MRRQNDRNEFIPCPFSGPYSPVWKINEVSYESFTVPQEYIPFPHGLLIPTISQDMNGTTFQCLVLTGHKSELQLSTIGTLYVV